MQSEAIISSELKRTRLAIFLFYFSQGLCFSSWASRIPDIKTSLGLDDGAWGTILLMIPLGQICGMTLSGLLVSKIGSKKILPIALILYVVALLLIGSSASEYSLILSLVLFGFCGNFCNISVNTQGVNVETNYGRSIMSSFHGGWSLAGFAGSSVGLLMINIEMNPLYHFLCVGTVVLMILFLNFRYLQSDVKVKKVESEGKKKNKPEKFLFLLGAIAFCGMAAEGAMADWSGLYFKDVVKTSEKLAPLALTAYMITMASARFMVDRLTEKLGRKRIIQLSGALIFTGLAIAVAVPNLILTTIAFMIVGLGTASIVPTAYSVAGHKTKMSTGMALTIVSSVSFLGFLLGPPILGYISAASNLRYSFAFVAALALCIIAISSKIKVLRDKD